MIWGIIYILIAALVTFALRVACIKVDIRDEFGNHPTIAPVVCGVCWPIAGPIYAAYIAAKWVTDNYKF